VVATTWNQLDTEAQDSMPAEIITIKGHDGDEINAYLVRPGGPGPFPGIVLIHHMPGWDEFYRETARRFAAHGYVVICPNLYARYGYGTPDDAAAKARGAGGAPDNAVVGDLKAGLDYLRSLPYSTGKVGIIGTCSGGRQAYLTACATGAFDAIVDCWGGGVVQADDQLSPQRPVSPHTLTKDLNCPVLGIFGNEDQNLSGAGERPRRRAEEEWQGVRFPPLRWRGPRLLVLRPPHLPSGASDGCLEQSL
jgi:carboxymethylenebutenolidase